jgi:hypothetical protein
MVSAQNIRQHNQSQTGISFGFDEMGKLEANPTDWLMRIERMKLIKTPKSDNFMMIFTC